MSLDRSFLPFSCGNDSFRRFSTFKVISAGRWPMLFSSPLFELEVLINSYIVWIHQSRQDPRLLIMWQTCCCARRLKPKNVSFLLTVSRIPVVYSSWWCEASQEFFFSAFCNHVKERLWFWSSKVSLVAWFIFLPWVILFWRCALLWYQGNFTPCYLCLLVIYSSVEQLPTKFETPPFFFYLDVSHVVSSMDVMKPPFASWPWDTWSF